MDASVKNIGLGAFGEAAIPDSGPQRVASCVTVAVEEAKLKADRSM